MRRNTAFGSWKKRCKPQQNRQVLRLVSSSCSKIGIFFMTESNESVVCIVIQRTETDWQRLKSGFTIFHLPVGTSLPCLYCTFRFVELSWIFEAQWLLLDASSIFQCICTYLPKCSVQPQVPKYLHYVSFCRQEMSCQVMCGWPGVSERSYVMLIVMKSAFR